VKAVIEYDGQAYVGFQRQSQLPTVQSALERAIEQVTGTSIRITASGRTDSGAHAVGQVISFEIDSHLEDATLTRAINAKLAGDIAVQSLSTTAASFDPRRQAVSREYHYLVLNRLTPSPLWRGRALHVDRPLDIHAMRLSASHIVGTHDFSSFVTPSRDEIRLPERQRTSVRTLYCLEVLHESEFIRFRFVGSGFMQHMIRAIVGTLVMVGEGRIAPSDIAEILAARDHSRSSPPVPAHGLYLMKVCYGSGSE
jgi:tRNA pseudouridine38-40 synthase